MIRLKVKNQHNISTSFFMDNPFHMFMEIQTLSIATILIHSKASRLSFEGHDNRARGDKLHFV